MTGGQHLPQDGFRNLCLVDSGAGDDRLDHRGTKIMGWGRGEGTVETADGSAGGRDDNDIGHGAILFLHRDDAPLVRARNCRPAA